MIIGFSKRKALLSRLIQFITKSECSHCYIYEPESGLVYHAQGLKVNALSYTNFRNRNTVVWETEAIKVDWIWLREQLGKPYGMLSLIGYLMPILFNRKNPFNDSDHSFVCSELVARSLEIPNAEKATPDDLIRHLRDSTPLV
jgi:hypothetical protein